MSTTNEIEGFVIRQDGKLLALINEFAPDEPIVFESLGEAEEAKKQYGANNADICPVNATYQVKRNKMELLSVEANNGSRLWKRRDPWVLPWYCE